MTGPILRTDLVTVFPLRAYAPSDVAERLRDDLHGVRGVHHVMVANDPGEPTALITADVDPAAADRVLEDLRQVGIGADDRACPATRRSRSAARRPWARRASRGPPCWARLARTRGRSRATCC